MSFKKNLHFLVFWGCITSYSSLTAQIRRPGSENESKPANSTSTTKPNSSILGTSSNNSTQVIPSGTGINTSSINTNSSVTTPPNAASTNPTTLIQPISNPSLVITKQKKGNYNIEALVNIGNSGIGIGVDEFKARYFYSNKRAYRVRFSGIIKNDLNDISPNKTIRAEVKYDRQQLLIAGGIEEHYNHTNRINSYIGFAIGGIYDKESTHANNSKDGINFAQGYKYEKSLTESALFINGVLGMDYYLNSQFYIGAELMVGVSNRTTDYTGIRIISGGNIESQDGFYSGGGFEGHLTYSKGIRLGYKF